MFDGESVFRFFGCLRCKVFAGLDGELQIRFAICFRLHDGAERQQFEVRLLFVEGLVDDALGGGVNARIGNRIEPMP